MEDAPLPIQDKWDRLRTVLPAAIKDQRVDQAGLILDAMEGMAAQGGRYRGEFLRLLEDDRNYSPAWTLEDAVDSRIKFHELEGNLADATALLRSRFFTLRQADDPASVQEAQTVLERMEETGADRSDLEHLRSLLPQGEPEIVAD